MDFSASAATKDAARTWRRRSCTPPRFSSTLPDTRATAFDGVTGPSVVRLLAADSVPAALRSRSR